MKRNPLYIGVQVLARWVALVGNLVFVTVITEFLADLYHGCVTKADFVQTALLVAGILLLRFALHLLSEKMRFLCVRTMKTALRTRIYQKLLRLGAAYQEQATTGGILQDAVEGVDQLEHYYGTFLPDCCYGLLATATIFGYLMWIHLTTAACLLLSVAMMPLAIAGVQTLAKGVYGKYWEQYTVVSHSFLENLQGLSTLKIYQADQFKQDEMRAANETLRQLGMKVALLRMDSITVMDVMASLGIASGSILAVAAFVQGDLNLGGCLHVLVLAAECFLPMRTVGEHFHGAMKGRAANARIKKLLQTPERKAAGTACPTPCPITCRNLSFAYEDGREILHHVTMTFQPCSLTAIVGASGCGKSTVAGLIMGRHAHYKGDVCIGDVAVTAIDESSLLRHVTYVNHQPHFFHGTVAENLRLARPHATDEALWQVLDQVHIGDALRRRQGLDTRMEEQDIHLSGGQLQRIGIARAILHDSDVYIFDEATSHMEGESERYAMEAIYRLAQEKTVILISHRLPAVVQADCIYVMEQGRVAEQGIHDDLIDDDGVYAKLWRQQHRVSISREGGDGV